MSPEQNQLNVGQAIYSLVGRLFPICRSITGNGVRESLSIIKEYIPLEIFEIPSGQKVFDWEIPLEWNIRDAWVKDQSGKKVINFKDHNLHILNYSVPFHGKLSLSELNNHLFSLPDQPDALPYRTSYYQRNWGFCISEIQRRKLKDEQYEVYIDASLEKGSLTYGEYFVKGESEQEFVLSAHICHPSLANDNLSAVALVTHLAKLIISEPRRFSYRFIFAPGTIGAITWLYQNKANVDKIQGGLVVSMVGDSEDFNYKQSRKGNAEIDRVVQQALIDSNVEYHVHPFEPYGYDERQYCSPGFDLPFGNLGRSTWGSFKEYHTSGDNLDFINPVNLQQSFELYEFVVNVFEENKTYINLYPYGEPQLGKHGLYDSLGDSESLKMALLWVLNLSDGNNDLVYISNKSGISFRLIAEAVILLSEKGLLKEKI